MSKSIMSLALFLAHALALALLPPPARKDFAGIPPSSAYNPSSYESLRGDKRVFLQGMERVVLSGGLAGEADAALLRRALSFGRNQQHFLPHAQGPSPRR